MPVGFYCTVRKKKRVLISVKDEFCNIYITGSAFLSPTSTLIYPWSVLNERSKLLRIRLLLLLFFFEIYLLHHHHPPPPRPLCWVFVAARRLSLVGMSGGYSLLRCMGFLLQRLPLLWSVGFNHMGSAVAARGLCCSTSCGIFPDQGLNLCPLHWQVYF